MQFIGYQRASMRGCKVDWDTPVEVDDEVRRALKPHDPDDLRAGRLRRPIRVEPPTPGRRSRQGFVRHPRPEPTTHDAGALVFAYGNESFDSYFLIEAPDNDG